MKAVIIASILLAIFAIIFPFAVLSADETVLPPEQSPSPAVSETPAPSPVLTPESYPGSDTGITVNALIGGEVLELSLGDYLTGVVAGEMPALFELEALKTQAVAARTYTLYKMVVAPSSNHPDADVCDDITCCKAFTSQDKLKADWGEKYDEYIEKIRRAVSETDGVIMIYEDLPLLAVFHSSSTGFTEDSGNVWGADLPYLRSVESPESPLEVPNYFTTLLTSLTDFKNTVADAYPQAVFGEDYSTWISNAEYSESGRLLSVDIGGVSLTGVELRAMFGLRSAAIKLEVQEEGVLFSVTAYGHGVGMSQYGANALAKQGEGYGEILLWYYSGAQFANAAEVLNSKQ